MIAPCYCRQPDDSDACDNPSGVVSVPTKYFTIHLSTSVVQSHLMFVIL